jgi:hypothetical protein
MCLYLPSNHLTPIYVPHVTSNNTALFIYLFPMILSVNTYYFLNALKQLIFCSDEVLCIFLELQTEFLNII